MTLVSDKNLMTQPHKNRNSKNPDSSSLATSKLGGHEVASSVFPQLDATFKQFHSAEFGALDSRKRFRKVNQILVKLVLEAPEPAFLLAAVMQYIDRVNSEGLLRESYRFAEFEFWLNNFSELSEADNYRIRAKISGKYIPRDEYQCFFPIGMGKRYVGTHFVSAHISPDVDTTVASFMGWLDAFSARVGDALHIWSLPGGAPESHITRIMQDFFGKGLFNNVVRASGNLTLTAMDLLTQSEMEKTNPEALTTVLDHGPDTKAIVAIDDAGHYVGDWRSSDVEPARLVSIHFSSCLRWFEKNLHSTLIALFSQPKPTLKDVPPFLTALFDARIYDCEPVLDLSEVHRRHLNDYLLYILGVKQGLNGTFSQLSEALYELGIDQFADFKQKLEGLTSSGLFDQQGNLKEERPKIFHYLHQILQGLAEAIQVVRTYIDRLDVMMAVKFKVLGIHPQYVTLRSDVEEVRVKMKNNTYLTVAVPASTGKWFPVGTVRASDLRMPLLGTVTLRDFCNLEEIKMASYLEVISVIDHHKTSLKTSSPPLAIIGDAQSCNVLIAELAFRLNDRFSLGGMDATTIRSEGQKLAAEPLTLPNTRLHQRNLLKQIAVQDKGEYWIHPLREYTEYLCFLYAILDDTDLLSKVSSRDVECVAQLLNRIKSLSVGQTVEIISLDDIPRDRHFAKKAAERILQNEDMYSLYKKIYDIKELEVEGNLNLCAEGQPSNIFSDTKVQNRCCRVGQVKLFSSNWPLFNERIDAFRKMWLEEARAIYAENPEVDLHILLVSTITGAEEVYSGTAGKYNHKDQMWIWIPTTQLATEHLSSFLNAFGNAPEVASIGIEVESIGSNADEFDEIFSRNFGVFPRKIADKRSKEFPIAVLRYNAGMLNSRKSMITPYIPRLIS